MNEKCRSILYAVSVSLKRHGILYESELNLEMNSLRLSTPNKPQKNNVKNVPTM